MNQTLSANRLAVIQEAVLHPVPLWMVLRQVEIESGFDNTLTSHTGCVGVAQILPAGARDPGYGIGACPDPLRIPDAIAYLCRYLVVARARKGSWGHALLAYNVGMSGDPHTASRAYRDLAAYVDLT